MNNVTFFYKGDYHDKTPTEYFPYITIINYFPQIEFTIRDLYKIPNIKEIINLVRDKKTILVIFADDEGYFLGKDFIRDFEDTSISKLNNWTLEQKLDKNFVHFVSHNLISKEIIKSRNYNLIGWGGVYNSESHLILDGIDGDTVDYRNCKIKKLFVTYNKTLRLHKEYLILNLLEKNLLDFGFYSFNKTESNTESIRYLKNILNLDTELCHRYSNLNKTFFYPDKEIVSNDPYGPYLIINHYKNTFFSIVSETLTSADTVYFSEKIFKPIACLHPFVVISSQNSLKELKKLGYKTFDKWWDESYDEEPDVIKRINKVTDIVSLFSKKTNEELDKIKLEMYDILQHNRQLFLKRRERDFLKETLILIEKN